MKSEVASILSILSLLLFLAQSSFSFTLPIVTERPTPPSTIRIVGRKHHTNIPPSSSSSSCRQLSSLTSSFTDNNNKDEEEAPTTTDDDTSSHRQLGAWIPIGSASSLQGLDGPTRIEIMGQDFVVWYSPLAEEWSVMTDICPHRLAPLSQGRICDQTGNIECGYHGWQFLPHGGKVCKIPQLEEGKDISKINIQATAFDVHLTGDLIWAFLPTEFHGESFPKHVLPEDYFKDTLTMDMARDATYYSHEMPSSFHMNVENALDPSHFAFAHHGIISRRDEDAAPMPDMKVETFNFTNLDIYTSYKRNGQPRQRLYSFQRPCLVYTQERVVTTTNDGSNQEGWVPGSLFFLVPIREGRTRLITSVAKLSKSWLPDWMTHIATKRLLEGDYFTHEAEINLRLLDKRYIEPTTSDTGPRAWNKWMKTFGFVDSSRPPHTFGLASPSNLVPMTMSEKRNFWIVHTKTCSKCRAVLRRARRAQVGSILLGILVASVFQQRQRPLVAGVTLCIGILASLASKKLAQLLEGSSHPSDIPDRDPAMMAK